MNEAAVQTFLPADDYDLAATLTSGQAFRWELRQSWWEGVVDHCWLRLQSREGGIAVETVVPQKDWTWVAQYLQTNIDLRSVLLSFPDDEPMRTSVAACRGLRLLRQDPWECLASFILSSTKQIVQIRQIVALLAERFGEPIAAGPG